MDDALASHPPPTNPDTVYLLGLMFISGIAQAASGAESGSVEALVPEWMLIVWTITLLAGSALTLVGSLRPGRVNWLLVEGVGRTMLGPAAAAYAVAIIDADPGSGALLAGLLLGLTISCCWRLVQIRRSLNNLRVSMRAIAARMEETP